jgi:hypothetical protein
VGFKPVTNHIMKLPLHNRVMVAWWMYIPPMATVFITFKLLPFVWSGVCFIIAAGLRKEKIRNKKYSDVSSSFPSLPLNTCYNYH